MGSSRLPGKVLKDIDGCSMLERVILRVRQARSIFRVVVATTEDANDQTIVLECQKLKVDCFCGSENDVLDRYYHAWRMFGGDAVARITSDCPLIAPEIIDHVVSEFKSRRVDYASNVFESHDMRGLDVEVMKPQALEKAWREATQPEQRVHVTPFMYQNPKLFNLIHVPCLLGEHKFRLTVDTMEDLEMVRAVYNAFGGRADFSAQEVINLLLSKPEIANMNAHIRQKRLSEL